MFKLRSIRNRLIGTYLLIIILPFGLLSWLLLQWFNQYYLTRLQEDMNVEASIINKAIADDMLNGKAVEAKALINNTTSPLRSQARVFLFDKSGSLIAASDSAFASVLGQNPGEPGLQVALAGGVARGTAISPTTNIPVVYVAQPIIVNGQVAGAVHFSYSLADIEQAETKIRLLLMGVILLVIVIASLLGFLLMQGITRPLARLSVAAVEIANGRFDERVSEDVPAEMLPLSQSFNQMAEALQKSEQVREMAFANIAHDVRTPLGSIQAAAEALLGGAIERPGLRERLLNGLVEHTQYLDRLTNDLLRLAVYEGGGLVLRQAAVDLGTLIHQAVRGVEARAQLQGVTISIELPSALPAVWADADRVLEVLFNLLDNALAYTPGNGQIRVWTETDPAQGRVWVHVFDTGPGIPGEKIPHLFKRYWRGDYRRANTHINMGLGLNIVQEIVSAHGGTIAVENLSDGPDIHFALPVAQGAS